MKYKCIFTDLDGTVYLDSYPIGDVINNLNNYSLMGGKIFYLSNNTSTIKTKYYEKLRALGINNVDISDIITPIDVLLFEFKRDNKINTCYYILPDQVINYIIEHDGPKVNEINPDAVVVGFDKELTYKKLERASLLISKGTPYFLTHNDFFCPTQDGPIPDAGSIANLINKTTGLKPKKNFGKPSFSMVNYARELIKDLNINASEIIMIGDRKGTDIKLGKNIGFDTCYVLTGDRSNLNSRIFADYECSDINYFFENHLF